MDSYKLRLLEGIGIILTILLAHVVLSIPSNMISATSSSTLLNTIFITILSLLFFLVIYKLFSLFPGCNIIDICGFLGGKFFKIACGICYIAYILVLSAIMVRSFAEGIFLIFSSHIDLEFILLIFVVSVGILSFWGLKSISRLNLIMLPIMIFSIVFLFFASFNNYTFQRIFPILGYGLKETFWYGIGNIYAFSGLYVIFFIFPLLQKVTDFKKAGFTSILSYASLLLLAVSALLFSIPQMAHTSSPLSLYLLARQITLGEYFQSIDALFLLAWVPFMLTYLSINLHFALDTFKAITNVKYRSGMIYSFCAIFFVISLLANNMAEVNLGSNIFYKYVSIGFVFILSPIILILAAIKKLMIKLLKKEVISNV